MPFRMQSMTTTTTANNASGRASVDAHVDDSNDADGSSRNHVDVETLQATSDTAPDSQSVTWTPLDTAAEDPIAPAPMQQQQQQQQQQWLSPPQQLLFLQQQYSNPMISTSNSHSQSSPSHINYNYNHNDHNNNSLIQRVDSSDSLHPELEPPNFGQLRTLIAGLLLSTFLALCSALDAKTQCLHPENYYQQNDSYSNAAWETTSSDGYGGGGGGIGTYNYYYYNNNNNNNDGMDNSQQQYQQQMYPNQDELDGMMDDCIFLFRKVMVPVTICVAVLGIVSLVIIHRHWDNMEHSSEHIIPSHLCTLLQLSTPFIVMGSAWMYAIYFLMFKIKFVEDNTTSASSGGAGDANIYDDDNNSGSSSSSSSYFHNPFKSLGAVDKMGHVGINANLYYLSLLSMIIVMVLLYNNCVDICRWWHRGFTAQHIPESGAIRPTPSFHDQVHAMFVSPSATSSVKKLASFYRQRRKTWYQFLLRLRERSGYWVAAFFCSLLVFASSTYVYFQVLVNLAYSMTDGVPFQYRRTCLVIQGNDVLPDEFCKRTTLSVLSGAVASILSLVAIIVHLVFRRGTASDVDHSACGQIEIAVHSLPKGMLEPVSSNVPLKLEFLLSLIPSVLLGLNAMFATGAQGPASEVGNLYYASFASFFFMVRISLGTLEELTSLDKHDNTTPPLDCADPVSCQLERDNNPNSNPNYKEDVTKRDTRDSDSQSSFNSMEVDAFSRIDRRKRLRKFLLLAIFSGICSVSAWDAADNQDYETSRRQKYMIFAPAAVSGLSTILFLMCLRPSSYSLASNIFCGGVVTIVMFLIWFVNLLITMHSEDSWAVNGIGEIRNANLYYFSWASIIVAALQLMSYAESIIGHNSKDFMFLIWATNVKVCFVILGAALHVWHGIADTCGQDFFSDNVDGEDMDEATVDAEEFESEVAGNDAFCSRTKLALGVAATGIVSGWLAMGSRILGCPITQRYRVYTETFISILLVIIFGAGVAFITGIGGPGQSVGDLYYASWLAFGVSLGSVVACIDQIQQQELESQVARFHTEGNDCPDGDYMTFQDGQQ